MENQKREELIELYDLYNSLLTSKQREYFEEYYFMDLSISEIAENHDISRNGVFDQLKRVNKLLTNYEEKLKLSQKFKLIEKLNINEEDKNKILEILKE